MRLGQENEPCVIWAWGCAVGPIWEQANIVGKPDKRWDWLTLSQGSESSLGLKRGQFLEIVREGRVIGVAEVDKVDPKRTIAWILEGTMHWEDRPKLGDEIRILA